jgi:hypothetical protein
MGIHRISNGPTARTVAASLLACICAGAIPLAAALAQGHGDGFVQESGAPVTQGHAGSDARPAPEGRGLFGNVTRWFDRQASKIGSGFKDAGSRVEKFGHQAGNAARTTAETAKNAADAMVRIPSARLVTGHEKCKIAPNGAPDCVAAANALCKAKGFGTGKSADMTTTEVCPAQVYLSGRTSGAGCRTETYVSSALCQ